MSATILDLCPNESISQKHGFTALDSSRKKNPSFDESPNAWLARFEAQEERPSSPHAREKEEEIIGDLPPHTPTILPVEFAAPPEEAQKTQAPEGEKLTQVPYVTDVQPDTPLVSQPDLDELHATIPPPSLHYTPQDTEPTSNSSWQLQGDVEPIQEGIAQEDEPAFSDTASDDESETVAQPQSTTPETPAPTSSHEDVTPTPLTPTTESVHPPHQAIEAVQHHPPVLQSLLSQFTQVFPHHETFQSGEKTIRLDLNPPELGQLTIHVQIEGDSIKAIFQGNESALNLLRQVSSELAKNLQDMGFSLDSGSFEFDHTSSDSSEQSTPFDTTPSPPLITPKALLSPIWSSDILPDLTPQRLIDLRS